MPTHLLPSSESKSQSQSLVSSQSKKKCGQVFQFQDNRPEAVETLQQTEMMDNSPQVRQLMAFGKVINRNSPRKQIHPSQIPIQREPDDEAPLSSENDSSTSEESLASSASTASSTPEIPETQVPWETHSRARFARSERRRLGGRASDASNFATVKLRNRRSGSVTYVTRKNQGQVKGSHNAHSEHTVKWALEDNFPPEEYAREYLYSERAPCRTGGTYRNCAENAVPQIGPRELSYSEPHQRGVNPTFRQNPEIASDAESESDYTHLGVEDFDPLTGQKIGNGQTAEERRRAHRISAARRRAAARSRASSSFSSSADEPMGAPAGVDPRLYAARRREVARSRASSSFSSSADEPRGAPAGVDPRLYATRRLVARRVSSDPDLGRRIQSNQGLAARVKRNMRSDEDHNDGPIKKRRRKD